MKDIKNFLFIYFRAFSVKKKKGCKGNLRGGFKKRKIGIVLSEKGVSVCIVKKNEFVIVWYTFVQEKKILVAVVIFFLKCGK